MRRISLLAASAAVLVGASVALAVTDHPVSLTATGPQPTETQVTWGDRVVFTNATGASQTLTIPRLDVTQALAPGASHTQVFDGRRGAYSFRQRAGNQVFDGTVVVDVSGELTLAVVPTTPRFGQAVRFTGRSPFSETPVVIEGMIGGKRTPLATVTPAADGAFTVSIRLARGGRLEALAAARQARSPSVAVTVRPLLTLSAAPAQGRAGRFVTFRGRVRPGDAASAVRLETYDTRRKRWVRVKSAGVRSGGVVAFSVRAEKGSSRYRLTIPRGGLKTGYSTVTSRTVIVRGT